MTYNDWVDQLKNNLLSVSEAERQKVLDYYAEAYADRRAAGFSESEIIAGFGAPYDAAQAILENETESSGTSSGGTHSSHTPPSTPPPTPPSSRRAGASAERVKHRTNVGVIIGVIIGSIIILGLAWFFVMLGISCAYKPEFTAAHYVQQAEDIQNINVAFSVGEIETVIYDGDKIEIDYHNSNIYNIEVYEKNGTMNFKLRSAWWRFGWGTINHPKTVIKLPQSCVYNFKISLSAGAATINGGTFENVTVKMSAGNVSFNGNVKCEKLNLDLSAGKIDADGIECTSLKVDSSAGKIDFTNLTCPSIDIDMSAGSVDLGIVGTKSDYTIKVDKSAGSCNVQNQVGNDPSKRIDIDLSAGSANVNFTN